MVAGLIHYTDDVYVCELLESVIPFPGNMRFMFDMLKPKTLV